MRRLFLLSVFMVLVLVGGIAILFRPILWSMLLFGPLIMIGFYDYYQKQHAVLRNFPLIGHIRYLFEAIRPEIAQYFIETETSGVPFSREQRSVVY